MGMPNRPATSSSADVGAADDGGAGGEESVAGGGEGREGQICARGWGATVTAVDSHRRNCFIHS